MTSPLIFLWLLFCSFISWEPFSIFSWNVCMFFVLSNYSSAGNNSGAFFGPFWGMFLCVMGSVQYFFMKFFIDLVGITLKMTTHLDITLTITVIKYLYNTYALLRAMLEYIKMKYENKNCSSVWQRHYPLKTSSRLHTMFNKHH